MFKLATSILFLLVSFIACRERESKLRNSQVNAAGPSVSGDESLFLAPMDVLPSLDKPDYKLDSLVNRFDSIQIRLWISNWLGGSKKVYVLKKSKREWSGELVTLQFDDKTFEERIRHAEIKPAPFKIEATPPSRPVISEPYRIQSVSPLRPKNGLQALAESLSALRIDLSLTEQEELALNNRTDQWGYYIEYATKGNYYSFRFYGVEHQNDCNELVSKMKRSVTLFEMAAR